MILQIQNQSDVRAPRQFIVQWLEEVERLLKRRRVRGLHARHELVIVFVTSKHMRTLNRQFRGRDYATDVLSFAAMEPGSLGDLVVCPQVVQRQAREHGLSFREELGYMLIHGLLHLLGYDHETNEEDARQMFALQDHVFEVLCRFRETGTKR